PFGFSLFYLRGVADKSIKTKEIYTGVVPFILIQLIVLIIIIIFPKILL
ncbi:MAG: C4-dicarboxylate ABC transporter, partial [Gammaproteobacteria bacterium]|nr:C4-dicarboxylate ABC transporter [Gammaproteobacteria bacterium]